ncbi:MAG: DUF2189 domain-containing protein [Pseudomonadota bacterium]
MAADENTSAPGPTHVEVPPASPPPELRELTTENVKAALRKGFEDFRAAPKFGLFFGTAYVVCGYLLWILASSIGNSGLLVPLAFVFPLLGPFVAIGLYEVSRRLETGEPLEWGPILRAPIAKKDGQIPFMGVVVLFMALVWIVLSRITFAIFMGAQHGVTNVFSSTQILYSIEGMAMTFFVGVVGFAVAALVFAITVVGMPLLLDRDLDVVTAMITSFEAVTENLQAMLLWAAIVVGLLVVGMLPAFLGLIVVLPVLGHGTWHLYRATVS